MQQSTIIASNRAASGGGGGGGAAAGSTECICAAIRAKRLEKETGNLHYKIKDVLNQELNI